MFFQYALEDQLRGIVEQALGRRTVAFVSGIDATRDVAMEIFTLEPSEDDGSTPRNHRPPASERTIGRRRGR